MSAQVAAGFPGDLARWCDRAGDDPDSALRKARRWLSRAANDTEARVLARHVASLASLEKGEVTEGRRHARLGLVVARRLGMRDMQVRLRLTLAWLELERGAADACRAQLRAVQPLLRAADHVKVACVRGMLHRHADRYADAVSELTRALQLCELGGDRRLAADALLGRGLARLSGGWLDGADADLVRAEQMFTADGRTQRAALCVHKRGNVALRAGELPQALRRYAEAVVAGLDNQACSEARAERAEALAAAGMNSEARGELERAATTLTVLGRTGRLGEITQALAECDLRDGAARNALDSAGEARRLFRARGRPAWAALALATQWRARLQAGHRSRYTLAAARRAAAKCADFGWVAAAAELWLACGRAARDNGSSSLALAMFAAASSCRRNGSLPAHQQALGWLGAALHANEKGDREGVLAACGTGLRLVADHAASMRAVDLRVQAFGLAGQLSETALGAAVRSGDPEVVLRWSERCRAGALERHDATPLSDPALRRALGALREAVAGSNTGDSRVRSGGSGVAALEDRVRDTAMLVDGALEVSEPWHDLAELQQQLGESVLVSFFTVRGMVHSVSVADGRTRMRQHGPESELGVEVDRLRYCLQRQATATDHRVASAFASGARNAAEFLERSLLAPVLEPLRQGRQIVVVPTGRLHLLPWAALPACRGAMVTVTPSLRCWIQAARQAGISTAGRRQVWVAGPGLDHADGEVRSLHATAGGSLLTGAQATADRVLREVDGAATVHIAAHGRFRPDRPLLSCLDLADGPLYGYDLDQLWRGPGTVVLSACEVGRSEVSQGDELRGLAAALLGRGTATVIASVVTVPDERTAQLMVDVHAGLRRGVAPAAALAAAQERHGESGFVCLGYGGA